MYVQKKQHGKNRGKATNIVGFMAECNATAFFYPDFLL